MGNIAGAIVDTVEIDNWEIKKIKKSPFPY
jgi:hypothetical protein